MGWPSHINDELLEQFDLSPCALPGPRHERPLPLFGPQLVGIFALVALELIGHPKQRAKDGGAIIAGQLHDASLDDEAAEFDQVPRALAALDLPLRISCRALAVC